MCCKILFNFILLRIFDQVPVCTAGLVGTLLTHIQLHKGFLVGTIVKLVK